jgi:hypothetical protein
MSKLQKEKAAIGDLFLGEPQVVPLGFEVVICSTVSFWGTANVGSNI